MKLKNPNRTEKVQSARLRTNKKATPYPTPNNKNFIHPTPDDTLRMPQSMLRKI